MRKIENPCQNLTADTVQEFRKRRELVAPAFSRFYGKKLKPKPGK